MALQATNGGSVPNIDSIHRQVAGAIAGRSALLIRDDDLLNWNGLTYTAVTNHLRQRLVAAPYGDPQAGIRKLDDAELLIAGDSPSPYHDYATRVEAAAARDGWTKTRVWTLACGNTIALWRRAASPPTRLAAKSDHRSANSPYVSAVLADSPAAFWRLDGKTCNADDSSDNGNAGIAVGNPTFGAHPLIAHAGTSVHFDGKDDELTFRDSISLRPKRAITIEAWVRPDDVPTVAGSAWQLVSKWNTALLFLQGGPEPQFVFALYDARKSAYSLRVLGTTKVAAKHVYHVVGTYDGSKLRIYVNGSLESSLAYAGPLAQSTYGGVIGAKGWGSLPSSHFQGSLDEVAIYGTALSGPRVKAHYARGTAP
jgi:hypothetical protein